MKRLRFMTRMEIFNLHGAHFLSDLRYDELRRTLENNYGSIIDPSLVNMSDHKDVEWYDANPFLQNYTRIISDDPSDPERDRMKAGQIVVVTGNCMGNDVGTITKIVLTKHIVSSMEPNKGDKIPNSSNVVCEAIRNSDKAIIYCNKPVWNENILLPATEKEKEWYRKGEIYSPYFEKG